MSIQRPTHQTTVFAAVGSTLGATFLATWLSAQYTTHGSAVWRTILAAIGTTISRPDDAAEL